MQQNKRNSNSIKRLSHDDISQKNKNLIKEIYKLDFDLYFLVKEKGILIK